MKPAESITPRAASAVSHPNIALIKYWGNQDATLRLPANSSISMTLGGLETRTKVEFRPELRQDEFRLNGEKASNQALLRVSRHMDLIRKLAGIDSRAHVSSHNSYPHAAGVASSAAAFAALTRAGCAAAGIELSDRELSTLARRGSGSAARSIFGGFVEWHAAADDAASFAEPIAPPDHWPLVDLIAVVSQEEKSVGSTEGHALAQTSPLQEARVGDAERRLEICRQAILKRDFDQLAEVAEQDSNAMHAVMLTSVPPLYYWQPHTLAIMTAIGHWRSRGLGVFYTVDAGPNVHCICRPEHEAQARDHLEGLAGVKMVLRAEAGEGARLV